MSKKLIFLLIATLLMVGLSACNMDNDRDLTRNYDSPNGLSPYSNDNNNYGLDDDRNYNRYMYDFDRNNGYRTNDRDQYRTNANEEAEKIANAAAKVNGVDDATVVIAGRTAYVALDIEDRIQDREADNVEKNVYNALNQYANKYQISITSDDDLFGRLRDVGDGIRNGTPVERFQTDFNDFDERFRRIR